MTNVKQSISGNLLTIVVDLSQRNGASASGKTTIVASTHGAAKLPGEFAAVSVNLNVYTKA